MRHKRCRLRPQNKTTAKNLMQIVRQKLLNSSTFMIQLLTSANIQYANGVHMS